MADGWDKDIVVAKYKDLQATAMAIDCTGKFCLLAGRRSFGIVDLDEPQTNLVKKMTRQSKWEVSCVEWNPHPSHQHYFVTATNQRAEVCSWKNLEGKPLDTLKAHTRNISDLNWSPFEPDILATCSVDTFTHIWDIRHPRRPSTSFSAVAGASQVKWNRIDPNMLAISHEGDIRIWDKRQPNNALRYITAHLKKIHGLDWSPKDQNVLASSSQDSTVRFWNINDPKKHQSLLDSSKLPVWKARYTPFGNGMVTIAVPQLRRGDNNLMFWHVGGDLKGSVHQLVGHTDVVLEFHWKKWVEESQDYHLVSWSKDNTLRIWKIDTYIQQLCGAEVVLGYNMDVQGASMRTDESSQNDGEDKGPATDHANDGQKITEEGDDYQEEVDPQIGQGGHPESLQQEFKLINWDSLSSSIVEVAPWDVNLECRTCTISASSRGYSIHIKSTFPSNYPNNSFPTFTVKKTKPSLDPQICRDIIKKLEEAAQPHIKRNTQCLEPCIRQLVSSIEKIAALEEPISGQGQVSPYSQPNTPVSPVQTFNHQMYGTFRDNNIPFPRTSGARFSGVGLLVCFQRHESSKKNIKPEKTPKALSALDIFRSKRISGSRQQGFSSRTGGPESVSISDYYYSSEKKSKRRGSKVGVSRKDSGDKKRSSISYLAVVYDSICLLPLSQTLATTYVLDHYDVPTMCRSNASAAAAVGRKDLVQVWSLLAITTSSNLKPSPDLSDNSPWAFHPMGRKLIHTIIDKYKATKDVQTLAMLCCVLTGPIESENNKNISGPMAWSPPKHYTMADTDFDRKTVLSGSPDYSVDDYRFLAGKVDPEAQEKVKHEENMQLLDSKHLQQYDEFKRAYAEILYRWDLREARAEILKYVSVPEAPHTGVEFSNICANCQMVSIGVHCPKCKNYSFQCSICHISVRGSSSFCLSCGHGGHSVHMMEWFQEESVCPTGCGCFCLQKNNDLLASNTLPYHIF